MKDQRSDTKNILWLKKVKEKALMKLLDKMHKYKTMLSYCLKCKKIQKTWIQEFQKLVMVKQCYQNVLFVVLKNQNLLKNKKQV